MKKIFNKPKKLSMIALSLSSILLFTGCADTDTIGKQSITSFREVLNAMPDNVSADDMNGGWSLASPDGTERFIWSKDFSSGTPHDVMLEFTAQPFIDAGLDISKLPADMVLGDTLMVGDTLGDEKITYKTDATPLESYKKIVELNRERIKYHSDLDHYGINLGNGNMFEWAKDMDTNDKDIVFVLDPQTFIDAGVDPEKVEGWLFAKVTVMDENGKKIQVDKLLKPFEIQ